MVPGGRRYLPGTMVLETTWGTRTGWVIIRDVLLIGPWHHDKDRSHTHRRSPTDYDADHVLLRTLRCVNGSVEINLDCEPVMDYGRKHVQWEYSSDGYHKAIATAVDCATEPVLTTDLRLGVGGSRASAGPTKARRWASPTRGARSATPPNTAPPKGARRARSSVARSTSPPPPWSGNSAATR